MFGPRLLDSISLIHYSVPSHTWRISPAALAAYLNEQINNHTAIHNTVDLPSHLAHKITRKYSDTLPVTR